MFFINRVRLARVWEALLEEVASPLLWLLMVVWTLVFRRGQRVHRVVTGHGRGNPEGRDRVCLYSHFDRDSLLAPHVKQALAAVAALGYRIHFITTSPRLPQSMIDELAPYCERIIHKDNYGRDFGAWRLGWQLLREQGIPDELLLLNDSVYGPLTDLGQVFSRMNTESCDFWSITDSWERHYHLQSYFLVFRKRALSSAAFERFWRSFWLINHKRYIVDRCEIRLTQFMLKAGFVPKAMCPYVDVRSHMLQRLLMESEATQRAESFLNLPGGRGIFAELVPSQVRTLMATKVDLAEKTLNPMHYFWKELITDFGCPFLKVDLLTRNPVAIANAYQWKDLLGEKTNYDPALIESHLQRMVKRRVP